MVSTVTQQLRAPVVGGHKLRIDVTGKSLDVYLDDLYVRSLEFRSADVIRGGFGLATGPGRALYRNIRILARDPHDPAARIERQLAMKKVLANWSSPSTSPSVAAP